MSVLRLILPLLILCLAACSHHVQIDFNDQTFNQNYGTVKLNLPFDIDETAVPSTVKWGEILMLHVGKTPKEGYPAVSGKYLVDQGNLIFKPRFPPVPEQSYTVVFNAKQFAKQLPNHPTLAKLTYQTGFYIEPVEFEKIASVTASLPFADKVPANLLRFYLYFSHPMSLDNPYNYLTLLDENHQPVKDAFVELQQGLWDQKRTRLTVLIHPGRIKRGVGPNIKLGNVLKQNQRYRLILNKGFKDYRAVQMKNDFHKDFVVTEPIYKKLDLTQWTLYLPEPDSFTPLRINVERTLDPVLAHRMITLMDMSDHSIIAGKMSFNGVGNDYFFTPNQKWKSGTYRVQVENKLEDLAGNTLAWSFDEAMPQNNKIDHNRRHSIPFSL